MAPESYVKQLQCELNVSMVVDCVPGLWPSMRSQWSRELPRACLSTVLYWPLQVLVPPWCSSLFPLTPNFRVCTRRRLPTYKRASAKRLFTSLRPIHKWWSLNNKTHTDREKKYGNIFTWNLVLYKRNCSIFMTYLVLGTLFCFLFI